AHAPPLHSLSLHDALPFYPRGLVGQRAWHALLLGERAAALLRHRAPAGARAGGLDLQLREGRRRRVALAGPVHPADAAPAAHSRDRKSTCLNSSHVKTSYA